MTTGSQWIGDMGHLALADAMLGTLLIDVVGMLEQSQYPASSTRGVKADLTTKQGAREVERWIDREPELFGDDAPGWLSDVIAAADSRNELLHAVALDRCGVCGAAGRFLHPRSGREVDRTEATVRGLTQRVLDLHRQGRKVAQDVAERVNTVILARARCEAEETGETQNPPQVSPHHVTHTCAKCSDNGRASTALNLGTAVVVVPKEQWRELTRRLAL